MKNVRKGMILRSLDGVVMYSKQRNIDYSALAAERTMSKRIEMARQFISNAGVPCLTDALSNKERGGMDVIKLLNGYSYSGIYNYQDKTFESPNSLVWRLKCLRHQNGTDAKPGDVVEYVVKRMTHIGEGPGAKRMSNAERIQLRRSGDVPLEYYKKFKLDSECCFECTLNDALHFLSMYGIHYSTKRMIGTHNQEQDCCGRNDRFVEVFESEKQQVNIKVANK